MALVRDSIISDTPKDEAKAEANPSNEDLEDGEIEDDDDDTPMQPAEAEQPPATTTPQLPLPSPAPPKYSHSSEKPGRFERSNDRRNKYDDKKKTHLTEAEKSVMYLHKLERMEREKREKYRREQGAETLVVDDYASSIEKAIASVLKKDRTSDEEKDDEKRGKKRKKKDKDKDKERKKKRKDSPKQDEVDDSEMLNVRGGSPEKVQIQEQMQSPHSDERDSCESEYSSDHSREDRKERKRGDDYKRGSKSRNRDRSGRDRKYNRDRSREKRTEVQLKDSQSVCVFYIQGKCHKGDECPYSHEALPPMKLELCKFYLMDCCAKGEKCLYMHSEFPCKFYHTGLQCKDGDNCRFAHGKPLSEGLRQILFKHIETAPREILGTFPRMNRDEALTMITTTQKNLEVKYGIEKKDTDAAASGKNLIPSLFDINVPMPLELVQSDENKKDKSDSKTTRNRPSRWQDADPNDLPKVNQFPQVQIAGGFDLKGFYSERDQDMRINSNGDIDMRTLPLLQISNNQTQTKQPEAVKETPSESTVVRDTKDVDHRNSNFLQFDNKETVQMDASAQDVDSRQLLLLGAKDVDIRNFSSIYDDKSLALEDRDVTSGDEPNLEIVTDDDNKREEEDDTKNTKIDLPANLPKKQRELFLRIQAQQKENLIETQKDVASDREEDNFDWYSDDDDDNRLTIKDDCDDIKEKVDENQEDTEPKSLNILSPPQIKPLEVMEKLGDLSKIDISAEVTKLLSTINQGVANSPKEPKPSVVVPRDPRQQPASDFTVRDPRRARLTSTETKPKEDNKLSMYEQGGYAIDARDTDLRGTSDKDFHVQITTDIRTGRSDVDLRQLNLPFKAIENYTPATEIDASMNALIPLTWKLTIVDIPLPDYTGLKLNAQDAQTTGDPRLRKIFRLSTDEKDSPASPKQSPKAAAPARVDPRRRKQQEEGKADPNSMSYTQQLSMLQSSAFYQSLTSNQKLLLNQELSSRSDQSGPNDPILNGILSSLGLIPNSSLNTVNGNALSILANVNNLNPGIINPMPNPIILGQNPANTNMLGQNHPNILNQGLGQSVNPNILAQNPNVMNQMAQSMVQPGLLGAAPGIPNLPPDFQINFDPRNGGLLGNAPFQNFPESNFGNFNNGEDFYPPDNSFGGGGNNRNDRFNRGGDNRPRRGGRNNFNRQNRNFNRNRNRMNNRSHTPP